jgi:hypothetical protein
VQQWASLPVNALAQSGEFRVGLERRVAGFASPFTSAQGSLYERTSLGAFVYFGAQASLSSPAVVAQVFTIPAPGTAQRAAFDQAFPVSQYPQLTQASYIGFVPPSRDRAFQEYAAGFRLTTRFFYPSGAILPAPAMLSASFGQNQMITAGERRGIVGAFEAFYPLPLAIKSKEIGAIYVFGRATLRLGGSARLAKPPALAPAAVPVTDPAVAAIALPSDRDTYSIGVGIDAVQLMKRLVSVGR